MWVCCGTVAAKRFISFGNRNGPRLLEALNLWPSCGYLAACAFSAPGKNRAPIGLVWVRCRGNLPQALFFSRKTNPHTVHTSGSHLAWGRAGSCRIIFSWGPLEFTKVTNAMAAPRATHATSQEAMTPEADDDAMGIRLILEYVRKRGPQKLGRSEADFKTAFFCLWPKLWEPRSKIPLSSKTKNTKQCPYTVSRIGPNRVHPCPVSTMLLSSALACDVHVFTCSLPSGWERRAGGGEWWCLHVYFVAFQTACKFCHFVISPHKIPRRPPPTLTPRPRPTTNCGYSPRAPYHRNIDFSNIRARQGS